MRSSAAPFAAPFDGFRTAGRCALVLALLALAACYPRYDWRDYRPDCAKTWCGFVASFPGRVTQATREVPVGRERLPLALHVVSTGDVTFAIGAFTLSTGSDPAEAQRVFERKLLDDVGATAGRRAVVELRSADRAPIAGESFEAEGRRGDQPLRTIARFAQRRDHLVEVLVIGSVDTMATDSGRQAVETFLTSLRLD